MFIVHLLTHAYTRIRELILVREAGTQLPVGVVTTGTYLALRVPREIVSAVPLRKVLNRIYAFRKRCYSNNKERGEDNQTPHTSIHVCA